MKELQQDLSTQIDWGKLDLDHVADSYEKATRDSLWIPEGTLGRIKILGEHRLDLLERLSSNTFKNRTEGEYVRTALLEANGRLIDLLDVFIHADHLLVNTSPEKTETVLDWLQRHIFFQDDVSLEILGAWPFLARAFGPDSKEHLESHIGELAAIESSQFQVLQGCLFLPIDWPYLTGYTLLIDDPQIAHDLQGSNHYDEAVPAQAAAEALRIEAGIPRRGREITAGRIPLEVGLAETISFTKGCYIGQEVIARLESRGRMANELSGVRLTKAALPDARINQSGKEVGTLTSSAYSPEHEWIGLALIKSRRIDRDSAELTIEGEQVALEELPFPIA